MTRGSINTTHSWRLLGQMDKSQPIPYGNTCISQLAPTECLDASKQLITRAVRHLSSKKEAKNDVDPLDVDY